MIHYRDEHLGRLLQATYREFTSQLLQKLREAGYTELTQFQAELLSYIELDGSRIKYLMHKTGTTKQAVGETILRLEAGGYIRKTIDPKDKRMQVLHFTPLGEQFIFDEHKIKADIEQEYMAFLGRQEFEALQKILQTIATRKRNQLGHSE